MRLLISFAELGVAVIIILTCSSCTSSQQSNAPKDNVWRRHGEGRVREGQNLYMHRDEYQGYGIISIYTTQSELSASEKADAIEKAIDKCRVDYGGIPPAKIDPPLNQIVIVVKMRDGNAMGAVFDAHEILLGEKPSSVLAESVELHDRPIEVVMLQKPGERKPSERYVYPIIEEYDRLNAGVPGTD